MFEEFEAPRGNSEGWYVPGPGEPEDFDAFEVPTDLSPGRVPPRPFPGEAPSLGEAPFPGEAPSGGGDPDPAEVADDDESFPEEASDVSPVVLELEAAQATMQVAEARRIVALLDGFLGVLEGEEPLGYGGVPLEARRRAYALQAGLCLHKSPRAVDRLINAAWTARAELHAVWERFTEGGCTWQLTEIAVRQARGLEGGELATFDRRAVQVLAEQGITPPDAERRLHVLRERLHSDSAEERRERAQAGRTTTIEPRPDGQAALTLLGPAVEIVAIDDALTQQAVAAHGVVGEDRPIGALKLDIALDLLLCSSQQENGQECSPVVLDGVDVVSRRVPGRKPVTPTVLITIPAATAATGSAATCTAEPGFLSGYGPIDPATARSWAGTAGYWTRVFLDPSTGGLRDIDREARYIPPVVRRWLGARDDTCRAPGCRVPERHADLDHAERFEYGGPTDPVNLANLCRPHHQDKDDGMWTVRLHPDGAMTWRSAWGRTYTTEPAVRVERPPEETQRETQRETPPGSAALEEDAPF